jgi:hypothetical protein
MGSCNRRAILGPTGLQRLFGGPQGSHAPPARDAPDRRCGQILHIRPNNCDDAPEGRPLANAFVGALPSCGRDATRASVLRTPRPLFHRCFICPNNCDDAPEGRPLANAFVGALPSCARDATRASVLRTPRPLFHVVFFDGCLPLL